MINKEEYDDILSRYFKYSDDCCSCHISPPCSYCIGMPTPEELADMLEYEKNFEIGSALYKGDSDAPEI